MNWYIPKKGWTERNVSVFTNAFDKIKDATRLLLCWANIWAKKPPNAAPYKWTLNFLSLFFLFILKWLSFF